MIVLIRPLLTEKSLALTGVGKYTFEVARNASATAIARAVEATYKVDVTKVAVLNVRGNTRYFRRIQGTTSRSKKAIVTLAPKQKIPGFEVDMHDHAEAKPAASAKEETKTKTTVKVTKRSA